MNTIREIQALNKRELENGVSTSASWHADYRDTAYIYIGGLSFDLTEGDIITIFSQFGEPVYIKLVRDKDTGKSKGFAFLKYEDQRSTDLAVDNLGGATVLGRILKVDHTRYEKRDDEDDAQGIPTVDGLKDLDDEPESEAEKRPLLKEELELAELIRNHDDDDPMKQYLIQEKREEVAAALGRAEKRSKKSSGEKKQHRHSHRHQHRHGNDDGSRHRDRRHGDDEREARSRKHADSSEDDRRGRHRR